MPAPSIQDDLRYAGNPHACPRRRRRIAPASGAGRDRHRRGGERDYNGHDGTGDSTLFAVCDPDKVGEMHESILRRDFDALVASMTKEDDLLRARSRIADGAAAAERPNGRMFRLGTLSYSTGTSRSRTRSTASRA
jgi:hypothetical protein